MAAFTNITFEDAGGDGQDIALRMSEEAIGQLSSALSLMRVPLDTRREILSGERKAPFMLYARFHKMMRGELGESPIVKGAATSIDVEPIRPTSTHRVVGGSTRERPARKSGKARAGALSVEEQIQVKLDRKRRTEAGGRAYRDVLPTFVGPATGRRKGEPTGNIFATGIHRGTSYLIEEIAPNYWQAKVTKHPWSVGPRKAARGFMGAGGAGRTGRRGFMVGDLIGHDFPVFEGPSGWKEAQRDVEKAIDRSYEYRVETGNIPPELEKWVTKDIAKTRKGGRTPSLAPKRRTKNPKKKASKKKAKKTTKKKASRKGRSRNPTAEVHQEMGEGFLAESEKLWESYCNKKSHKTLLDAYRALELSCQEFEYTGDKKRMKQAKKGIRAARAEILACMKKR